MLFGPVWQIVLASPQPIYDPLAKPLMKGSSLAHGPCLLLLPVPPKRLPLLPKPPSQAPRQTR